MAYPIEAVLYEELPRYKVASLRGPGICKIDGEECDDGFVCTRSISTYPLLPGGEKDGDPIADRLYVQLHENRALVAVADGCNWGRRPQLAARDAISAFSVYFNERQENIRDLQDAGHYLLRSFCEAHNRIVQGKEDIWEAGTTTLLGALVLELEPVNEGDPRWGFLCASVGDCKAFLASPKQHRVIDVTTGNRNNVTDTRDPGGRLGPYVGHGWPDLRNLRLYFVPAEENDIAVLMSDGVHDNLDPQTLGKTPQELNLPNNSWDELSHEALISSKAKYMSNLLSSIVFNEESPSPSAITNNLINHCMEVTRKAREFMEKNPHKKQPTDYVEFPGKMDHTTCISFVVGNMGRRNGEGSSKASSSSSSQPKTNLGSSS